MRTSHALLAGATAMLLGASLAGCSSGSGSAASATGSAGSARSTASTGSTGSGTAGAGSSKYVMVSPGTGKAAAAAPTGAVPATATPSNGSGLRYHDVVEPFSAPGACQNHGSTQQMTACVLEQIVDVDSTINSLQLQRFEVAAKAQQPNLLAEDNRWAKDRTKQCKAATKSGGSLDQLTGAQCLLSASQERVHVLNNAG